MSNINSYNIERLPNIEFLLKFFKLELFLTACRLQSNFKNTCILVHFLLLFFHTLMLLIIKALMPILCNPN